MSSVVAGAGARGDVGSGTVLVVALCGVLLTGGLAAGWLAQAAVARHAVSSAADLGALAGADRLALGHPDACAVAAGVVERNGARLTGCRPGDDGSVEVDAALDVPGLPAGLGPATASARAGPAP